MNQLIQFCKKYKFLVVSSEVSDNFNQQIFEISDLFTISIFSVSGELDLQELYKINIQRDKMEPHIVNSKSIIIKNSI